MITVFRASLCHLCLICCFVSFAHAEEESENAPQTKTLYQELRPSFVANFGDTTGKRLKFIKADITIRASRDEALSAVMAHDALIRHQVVMMLSAQSEESLAGADGQEALRLSLLEKVKAVLTEETGKEHIDDLLFTSFVVQR